MGTAGPGVGERMAPGSGTALGQRGQGAREVVLSPEAPGKEQHPGLCSMGGVLGMLHHQGESGGGGGRRSLRSAEGEQWRKRRSGSV